MSSLVGNRGGPLNITPEGFVKLRGPNRAIEPYGPIFFVPHLFKYETCIDQFKDYDEKVCWGDEVIWDNRRRMYDMFLSKRIQSRFGPIEVDFAVYKGGVEARVEVSLTGCQFDSAVVYGCITAENSKLGERTRSFLFDRNKTEGIRLDVSPYKDNVMKLPLSRSKTVHPNDSDVTITVNIWQSSIMGSQDQPIAKNEILTFTCSSGQDPQNVGTLMGDVCQVNVGVVWAKTREPINIEYAFV
ncbi:60 kDa jasmonate-induced protein-like [Carex rostrata]